MPGSASSWSLLAELISSRSALAAVVVAVLDGILAACPPAIALIMLNEKSNTKILLISLVHIIVSPIHSWLLVPPLACAFSYQRVVSYYKPTAAVFTQERERPGQSIASLAVIS